MDMNLPVKDGWTACREAKADEAIRDIPIIALTAHAMEEDKARALAAGCTDFATKPVDFPALLSVIAAALNAHS
jgi:CheY-like chemotaxis protein